MIDTPEIKATAVGMIPRGSAKDLDREWANLELPDERWERPNLVTRKPVYIPDSNTPRFCVADVQAYDLVEKVF